LASGEKLLIVQTIQNNQVTDVGGAPAEPTARSAVFVNFFDPPFAWQVVVGWVSA
jgi:hypothetical protein